MTLKYKVGDVVVLAENVEQNWNKTFVPGVAVKIDQLCDHNSNDEHYTVALVSDPSYYWYIVDKEINHETTALLQMSNEGGYLVQKISVENEVVSSAVNDNESKAQDNSWYEAGEFRPTKTAEQIAEEEREKAINEMDSAVKSYGSWEICADLYDAGYRLAGEDK